MESDKLAFGIAASMQFSWYQRIGVNLRQSLEALMKFNLGALINPFGNREPSPELQKWLQERREWQAGADERMKRWMEARKQGIYLEPGRKNFDPELLPEPLRSEAIKYLRKNEG